jgi:hypothetical protein
MKLFVSALLLAALAAFAQNQTSNQGVAGMAPATGQAAQPGQANLQQQALKKAQEQAEELGLVVSQAGCPLYMESASVAPEGGYLPVTARNAQDGVLDLRFRNQSGKAIASVAVTARVNVKTNIYALDAHTVELRLTFGGTQNLDRDQPQGAQIGLPPHAYLFGVARVTLDQVTYADGSVWNAPASNNTCRTNGPGIEQIAK